MNSRQIIIIILILVILGAGVAITGNKSIKKVGSPTPTPTSIPEAKSTVSGTHSASLVLRDMSSSRLFKKGDTIPLTVIADSKANPIVGYDVVVVFDPSKVSYKNMKNLQTDFQIVPTVQKNKVILTGMKNIEIKEGTVFSSSRLAELSFEAVADGAAPFTLQFENGKTNDSNLMTSANTDVLGHTTGESVAIGIPVQLTEGVPTTLEGAMSVTLITSEKPPENCNDCMETASVRVVRGAETKELKFHFGGFVGITESKDEAFGYVFHAKVINNGSLTVYYHLK